MRYASIDIGTNTILMLIGEISEGRNGFPNIVPIEDIYNVPRLGRNVSASNNLSQDSIERALDVLRSYKKIAGDYQVDKIVASATSAVRDAVNKNEFILRVKDETGIEVEVIGGDTEAEIGFMAAVTGSDYFEKPTLVIDIGGGSTELSYGTGLKPSLLKSIDVGAVRITEKFFHHGPPSKGELKIAGEFIDSALAQFPFMEVAPQIIFGVAGTATTLALIAQGKYEFDLKAVTNYVMSVAKLREIIGKIKSKTADEILKLTRAAEGRADVLVAGAIILLKILEACKASEFITTDRGLRYGYMLYRYNRINGI